MPISHAIWTVSQTQNEVPQGTRYDRCPETFFSAIMLAAIVLFWL